MSLLDTSKYPQEPDVFQTFEDFEPLGIAKADEVVDIPTGLSDKVYLVGLPNDDPVDIEIWTNLAQSGIQFDQVSSEAALANNKVFINFNTGRLIFHSSNLGDTVYATYTSLGTFFRSDFVNTIADAIEKMQADLLGLQVYHISGLDVEIRSGKVSFGSVTFSVAGTLALPDDTATIQIFVDDTGTIDFEDALAMPAGVFSLATVRTVAGEVVEIVDLRALFNFGGTGEGSGGGGGEFFEDTEVIFLSPEYPHTVEFLDGINNIGTLSYDFTDFGANPTQTHNYVKWESAEVTEQHIDLIIRIRIPFNFAGWAEDPFEFFALLESPSAVQNDVEIFIYDTSDQLVPIEAHPGLSSFSWVKWNPQFV